MAQQVNIAASEGGGAERGHYGYLVGRIVDCF